ncbi:hypothetical protein [Parapedomonas caeni]
MAVVCALYGHPPQALVPAGIFGDSWRLLAGNTTAARLDGMGFFPIMLMLFVIVFTWGWDDGSNGATMAMPPPGMVG